MSPMSEPNPKRIGLALSGGGVRAAAFHAGVILYLAEQGLLEDVTHISSVSGGSLYTGLVLSASGYRWPSSAHYIEVVHPQVRKTLVSHSLQMRALAQLVLNPANWQYALSRANVVAQTIRSLWDVEATLGDLPDLPAWSINGTTGETGRRFRFKGRRMGDYELGYTDVSNMPLCEAMAVSAAFPGGIGPLVIKAEDFTWHKREQWGSHAGEIPYKPPLERVHLYDGGLYDNLGIEPLFDVGKQAIKERKPESVDFVLVSDAGAALPRMAIPHRLNPFRFKRIADIALDQTRALRVRAFVNFLQQPPTRGAYAQLGADPVVSVRRLKMGREESADRLLAQEWLAGDTIKKAALYPTTLKKMAAADFDRLSRHGYETAMWNFELFE